MKLARTTLAALYLMTTISAAPFLSTQAGKPADAKNLDWYQWRGPNRDGLSPDTGLLKQWPSGGPRLLWRASGIGSGFSSVSVMGTQIYTMGDVDNSCMLFALNAVDAKLLWQARIGDTGRVDHPGARSTPATDGKFVYVLGQQGDFVCVDAANGREVWRKQLKKDFGGQAGGWAYSESALLDGDHVICTPGGSRGTMLALKKETGEPVWQSKELKDSAQYTSLVPAEIGGVRQYLVLTMMSVAGIAAKDGKLLWRADAGWRDPGSKRGGPAAVVATPIYRDGLVFVTCGYGAGCRAFKITSEGGQFKADEVYSGKQIANHHGGVILVGDDLYGTDEGALKCIELKTGKVLWQDKSVGKGSVAYADGHLVVRSQGGPIALVEATPNAYKENGRFTPPDCTRKDVWSHPVIFGGKLYIRDQDVLLCYDVKAK